MEAVHQKKSFDNPMNPHSRIIKKIKQGHLGQGLLEFALVLPMFILLLYGVVEFGRYLTAIITINTASREAARYAAGVGTNEAGIPYYRDCSGIQAAALRLGMFASVNSIDIRYDHGPDEATAWNDLPVCSSTIRVDLADRVSVRVVGEYQPLLMFTGMNFPLQSTTSRTFVTKLDVHSTQYPITPDPEETPIVEMCDYLSISSVTNLPSSLTHYQFTITNTGPVSSVVPAIIDEIWITHTETKNKNYFDTLEIIDVTDPENPYSIIFDDSFPEVIKQTKTTYLPYNEGVLDLRNNVPVGVPGESAYQVIFSFTDGTMTWANIEVHFYNEEYEDCILKQP